MALTAQHIIFAKNDEGTWFDSRPMQIVLVILFFYPIFFIEEIKHKLDDCIAIVR